MSRRRAKHPKGSFTVAFTVHPPEFSVAELDRSRSGWIGRLRARDDRPSTLRGIGSTMTLWMRRCSVTSVELPAGRQSIGAGGPNRYHVRGFFEVDSDPASLTSEPDLKIAARHLRWQVLDVRSQS